MPSDIEIREVRPDEYAAAGEVTARAFDEHVAPASSDWVTYLARIADIASRARRTTVLVALVDGHIVGSATLELTEHVEPTWKDPVPDDEAHLRMVGVDPALRRRGIARALVNECISIARGQGRSKLTLETTERMHAAKSMYESMGFHALGAREVAPGLCFDGYELVLTQPQDAGVANAS